MGQRKLMSTIEQPPSVAHCCLNWEWPALKCVVHPALSASNFCFLGVISKPSPMEQLPKSTTTCLTPDLEVVSGLLASCHVHLVH